MNTPENTPEQDRIKGRLYELWIENGISRCKYYQGLIVERQTAEQIAEGHLALSCGLSLPLLLDARQGAYVMQSARKFMASAQAYKQVNAMAILIDHHVMKVLFNTLLRLKTCQTPARIFTNEQKALEWLDGFKGKQTERSNRYASLFML
jgi:hypothetical protein